MPRKSSDEHQANTRLGALGESLTKSFLLEWCDFVYDTCEKHPADLLCELGPAKYTVQVKTRKRTPEGKYVYATSEKFRQKSQIYQYYHVDILAFVFIPSKRVFFKPNNSQQNYWTFTDKIITPNMELETFTESIKSCECVPVIRPLLDEADK